jgi:hypothetical protein
VGLTIILYYIIGDDPVKITEKITKRTRRNGLKIFLQKNKKKE